MICKYFLHSFQRVSFVFVLTVSLSSRIFDISTMAYFSSLKSQESCQNIHKKRTVLTFHHNLLRTMASNCDDSTPNCVDRMEFLSALDSLKEQQKTSKSEITLFVDDNFYERATIYLVAKEKKNSDEIEKIITKSEVQTIKRKKWTVNSNNQIITCDNKVVLSKSQLHENLLFAHNRVAHRGRR